MADINQPIKWHGGKGAFNGQLAKWIIGKMPRHTHYVEPFFGGGAVLFHKRYMDVSEVVNDIDQNLMNFWEVLAKHPEELIKILTFTPFSEETWRNSTPDESGQIEAAAAFFIRYRQSRQGLGESFATLSRNRTRRGMNEQVSSWLSAIAGLEEAHNRLKRVVILNRPALQVILSQDGPNTFFYLDPPYLHSTRTHTTSYKYEMSEAEHETLIRTLRMIKGKFILSGYSNSLYETYAKGFGWNRYDFNIPNNASSSSSKQVMTESIWTNYK